MSGKISEYFKIQPKVDENVPKSSNIRDCKVVLNDIKNQAGKKELKLFESVSLSDSQNKKSKGKKFRCPICNIKLVQKNLELHMKAKHPDGQAEQFECDFDGKRFKNKALLYKHMLGHLPLVECKFCKKMYKPYSINLHLKNLHAIGKYFQCKICPKSFKSAHYLNTHKKLHNKSHKCDICSKVFTIASHLKQHNKDFHENGKRFECESCGIKFNIKGNLKRHQKTHDKNRPKPFKCQRCDYATDTKHSFKRHQETHDRQDKKLAAMKNPIKCEKCSTFCNDQGRLRVHMKHVHPKVVFQCDLCARFFKLKSVLISHMKVHRTPKN